MDMANHTELCKILYVSNNRKRRPSLRSSAYATRPIYFWLITFNMKNLHYLHETFSLNFLIRVEIPYFHTYM
jgi:hypothetical protein